jgi:hypothetical protein
VLAVAATQPPAGPVVTMADYGNSYDPLATLSERFDYLQGTWGRPDAVRGAHVTAASRPARRLSWITGIGTLDKGTVPSQPSQPNTEPPRTGEKAVPWLPPSADLVVGLHGRTALTYQVLHLDGRLKIKAGVWSSRAGADDLDLRQQTLLGLMRSCYLEVRAEPAEDQLGNATYGGFALGVPRPPAPRTADPATPWDRLLRALTGERWGVVLLAQPIQEPVRADMRDQLLTESRIIRAVQDKEKPQHPLAEAYLEHLKADIETLTLAGAVGAWRTAVYLLGDEAGYQRLSAAWRGLFAGSDARGLPVRVHGAPECAALARDWALPDTPAPASPGSFRFPFAAQTVLSSHQLAAYVHLPEQEHPGYGVEQIVLFDSSTPAKPDGKALAFGTVVDRTRLTSDTYWLQPQSLTKHAFVSGVTRAGKTNSILVLLTAAAEQGAKFLVLEPAKTEYRALLTLPQLRAGLRVFTAGDETIAPLRLNPLEVPAGRTSVATHLDLVRSLFTAAFAMWDPIPQILERALHRSYADRGWDVNSNTNVRLDATTDRASTFPTLSDLSDHADDVIRESGYDPEAMGRIRGALGAALGGLRAGGKGRMFDTNVSIDAEALFEHSVIIELEALGDEADKAFLMGLILIRLAEHRRSQGETGDLRHLLVVEEAHRLLSNKARPGTTEHSGDASGKAVETFTNLLAEVAAYGQGLVIADQVPSRLAPEVLKNTNLKLVHRLVAEDDRVAVGATMVMTPPQTRALATFATGRAAVFAEGEDSPVLIQVRHLQARLGTVSADDLRAAAASWHGTGGSRGCCGHNDPAVCERGRDAAVGRRFRALVSQIAVTLATNPDVARRLGPDLKIELEAALPSAHSDGRGEPAARCMLWHGADYLARRRGAQRGWTYGVMRDHTAALDAALAAIADGAGVDAAAGRYRDLARHHYLRTSDPFPACSMICPDQTCLYRWPAADTLTEPAMGDPLRAAAAEPAGSDSGAAMTAAEAVARWLTSEPKIEWSAGETARAWNAFDAAARCAMQLAIVTSRPDPSSAESIRGLIKPAKPAVAAVEDTAGAAASPVMPERDFADAPLSQTAGA